MRFARPDVKQDGRRHYELQYSVNKAMGRRGEYHCVAIAMALAAADDPADVEEVAEWSDLIIADMREQFPGQYTEDGIHHGSIERHATAMGLDPEFTRSEDPDYSKGSKYRRRRLGRDAFPTTTQWCRENEDVQAAILRGTGHAGYMFRDAQGNPHIFNMGSRKRIDHAVILESD